MINWKIRAGSGSRADGLVTVTRGTSGRWRAAFRGVTLLDDKDRPRTFATAVEAIAAMDEEYPPVLKVGRDRPVPRGSLRDQIDEWIRAHPSALNGDVAEHFGIHVMDVIRILHGEPVPHGPGCPCVDCALDRAEARRPAAVTSGGPPSSAARVLPPAGRRGSRDPFK